MKHENGTLGRFPLGVAVMDAGRLEDLRNQLKDLIEDSESIVAKADDEDRELTDEEVEKVNANKQKADRLQRQITARESIAQKPGPGRKTEPEPANDRGDRNPAQVRVVDQRGGFKSFGEFAMAVRQGSAQGVDPDNRLKALNAATSTEGTGADGGFAVPPEFRRQIWEKVMGQENLLTRTDQLVTGANSITIPKDETTPWQTSGGIQVYWESEAGQVDQSKVALEMSTTRLNKLMALVPVSEELLEDAPGLESYLRSKVPGKMASKINTSIVRGTGVGQMLGILNAPSTITVAKEQSQAADTVLFANINNMWNRMWAPCRRNAVWLINQDIEPQLDVMEFAPGSTVPIPVYLPAGGVSERPFATLKGRPVVPVEACSTLGDLGDIILTDLTQYMSLTKGQDIKTDVSIHLFFDSAKVAYRFILRINGQPWWGKVIDPQFGNTTRSWAVTLAERA